MDVDAALTEVPVNILPLIDDTDFKTIEGAIAYNAAGMALYWHFVTTAGAYTLTAVTPTTAGNYDWTDQGAAGIYTIEIPASGGASINNDTEGFGWFTGVATGVLPWRGPTIGFRAAALNNAMIDGGDVLDVSVTEWLGTAAATPTVAGVPEMDLTHINGTAVTAAAGIPEVKVASIAANAITATAINADAITDAKVAADVTIASVTGAVGSVTAGVTVTTNNDKTGYGLSAAAVQAIWDALTSGITAVGSIGKWVLDKLDATVSSRGTGTALDAAGVRTAVGLASANLDTQVGDIPTNTELATALGTADDAVLAAIAALNNLSSSAAFTAVLTTALTESYAADGVAPTLAQAIFLIQQRLTEFAIASTTITVKKLDGATTAATLTLDSAANPTSSTRAT